MQCPVCRQDQIIVEVQGVELDLCPEGHGFWFDADELRQLFDAAGVGEAAQPLDLREAAQPLDLRDAARGLEERLASLPQERARPARRCPRCRRRMVHVRASGHPAPVILDRCPRGHGLWFDQGELEQLLASELAGQDVLLARVKEFLAQFTRPFRGSPGRETS
ncbi:MAG: zf-TFIIB domain-containing protein [Planctomycetota bacterium]